MAQGRAHEEPEHHAPVVPLPLPPLPEALDPGVADFTAFYRRELPNLVTLAGAIAGTGSAEEVAQEALIRAHREWARIARFDKPGAWVRRVTINLARSGKRRQTSERRALSRLAQRRVVVAPPPEVDDFWSLVRALPDRQAAAVALYYLEDLSISDIAAALDCAEGTAKAHLHKARHTLARHLSTPEER